MVPSTDILHLYLELGLLINHQWFIAQLFHLSESYSFSDWSLSKFVACWVGLPLLTQIHHIPQGFCCFMHRHQSVRCCPLEIGLKVLVRLLHRAWRWVAQETSHWELKSFAIPSLELFYSNRALCCSPPQLSEVPLAFYLDLRHHAYFLHWEESLHLLLPGSSSKCHPLFFLKIFHQLTLFT